MLVKNKKVIIIIISGLVVLLLTIWSFVRSSNANIDSSFTQSQIEPLSIIIGETLLFYHEEQIERESFYIERIVGQTWGGYIAIIHNDDIRNRSYQSIVRLSECLSYTEAFFNDSIAWERFLFVAVNNQGWLYVLDTSGLHFCEETGGLAYSITGLYIYDSSGIFVEHIYWSMIPFEHLQNGSGTLYVTDDYLIHILSSTYTVLNKNGDIMRVYEREHFENEWLSAGSTVSNGYLFVLTHHEWERGDDTFFHWHNNRFYTVRKIEVSTGLIIWEKYWDEIDDVAHVRYCPVQNWLFLFHPNRIYIYDMEAGQPHQIKDLSNARLSIMQRMLSATLMFRTILSGGRIHLLYTHTIEQDGRYHLRHIDWVLVPLIDDEAQYHIDAVVRQMIDVPIIRRLGFFESFEIGMRHDLANFATRHGVYFEMSYMGTHPHANFFYDYIETINMALFSNTANWDIISIPSFLDIPSPFDKDAFIERGVFVDLLPYAFGSFNDSTRFYSHLFDLLKNDDGLYHLPDTISVPFVLVPNDYSGLSYIVERAQNWTWDDFLQIAHRISVETGTPAISSNNAFVRPNGVNPLPSYLPNPISNVPPFFIFDESLLFDLGNGERRDEFSKTLRLYNALVNSEFNSMANRSVFTFACTRSMAFGITETHTLLPMPTMRGEFIFYSVGIGIAVLNTGNATSLAAEFVVGRFIDSTPQTALLSIKRPNLDYIEQGIGIEAFNDYEEIINRVNTSLRLPGTIRLAINDIVVQYVQGALTHDAAVDRVADIMWIFINER